MRKRIVVIILLLAVVGVGVPAAVAVVQAQTGLGSAQELAAHQLWPQVRERLASYLWLHPQDGQARLLMAEAFAKDDGLPADEAASQAINCLAQIPDSSPLAAEARIKQARLTLLILQRPARAEYYLRRAIDLEGGLPAWQLLWTLLNITGRAEESEDAFWHVYELSTDDERPVRLREWYLNQFFPISANEALDRAMGILATHEQPTRMTESRRYIRFREREPEAAVTHAAVAQWCQQEGDPDFAVRVLDAAASAVPTAKNDSFFLSVSIATYLDLGQFEQAERCFRQWPEHAHGHSYWKWRAILFDEALQRHEDALAAYERALELWPGHADWRLHHRKAGCLIRLKRPNDARLARERADEVEAAMASEVHEHLRAALRTLDDPRRIAEIVESYRQLGRSREADAWETHLRRLTTHTHEPQ